MLVLVLEFSKISATTLYRSSNLRSTRIIVEREAQGASLKEHSRSSKTEDESQATSQSPDGTSAKDKYEYSFLGLVSPVV
jgi:hypothetical protein